MTLHHILPDMDEATFGALFREHAGTSREGAAFLARIGSKKAAITLEIEKTYAVKVEGFDGLFSQSARSRQEAIDRVLQVAILDPNMRRRVNAWVVE